MNKKIKLQRLNGETLEDQCKRLCFETFKDLDKYKLPKGCDTYEKYIKYHANDIFYINDTNEIFELIY
ncbi:hypothetical protein QTH25_13340 [Clostridium perfringens]|uniref:hypothetical protein n=1 Tax=Clostridium perfringens TaxID=1502 RepID=UPI00338F85E4|nr:hypothetical protein [Clostridium perfringens]